jgi:hypothetical protein
MALVDLNLSVDSFYQLSPGEIADLHIHHRKVRENEMDLQLAQTRLVLTAIYNTAGKTVKHPVKPAQLLPLASEIRERKKYKPPTREEVMQMAARLKGRNHGKS